MNEWTVTNWGDEQTASGEWIEFNTSSSFSSLFCLRTLPWANRRRQDNWCLETHEFDSEESKSESQESPHHPHDDNTHHHGESICSSIRETVCLTTQETFFWFQQFDESAFSSLHESTHFALKMRWSEFQQFAESAFSNLLKVFVSNRPAHIIHSNRRCSRDTVPNC